MPPKAVLIDIDGVLYVGDAPVPGAREAIAALNEHGIPYCCVSNTTRRSRTALAAKLTGLGFSIPVERILTPPVAAIERMREHGHRRCFLIATGDVAKDFDAAGIALADIGADAVIIADAGADFTYESLNRALRLLLGGADFIALEKDRYWKTLNGLELCAGAFVAALEYAAGMQATVVGKPSRTFFGRACAMLAVAPADALMIGDDIATDIGGAQNAGIPAALVKTGKYRAEAVVQSSVTPDYLFSSIADLVPLLR